MSIFSETITKAISDYRALLRRHLTQVDRMTKLQKLELKKVNTYKTDLALYKATIAIVEDIETTMALENPGYYSYSGIDQFCTYIKEYLNDYIVENGEVIHKARKASGAILEGIQLCSLPKESLDQSVNKKLLEFNEIIVNFGSSEQIELQMQILMRQQAVNPDFFTTIIAHLESLSGDASFSEPEIS